MKRIKTKSGVVGWQAKLRKVYASLDEFKAYCEIYAINHRIGYKTPEGAWRANPTIQGSVNPSDLRRVRA
jgi:hypothetical protein